MKVNKEEKRKSPWPLQAFNRVRVNNRQKYVTLARTYC